MAKLEDLKILMAEDNQVNRKLADLMFKRQQINADYAQDGNEAVEKCQAGNYHLVLMDIEMPGMNGVEAAQAIREKMGDQAPFIVALTAHAMDGQREEFLDKGMNDYLAKPIKMEALRTIAAQL